MEIFDTNSADKIQSQNYKGGESALPHAIIQGVILFVRIKQNFYIKSIKVAKLNLIFWINSATITTPNMKEVCQLS